MRVALMGRSLRGEFSGVVRYTDELIRALAPRLPGGLTVFLTKASDGLDGLPISVIRARFPTPNEYARAAWEQVLVPREIARLRPDVYHSPNYILPLAIRCATVVTVHDLFFFDPNWHRRRSRLYLSTLGTMSLRRATRVICVSKYTRARLLETMPSLEERVRVVSEGVHERFRPQEPAAVDRFRSAHGVDRPYVLFLGTLEPRKNLARLVHAYERAVAASGAEHDLVIVGGAGWKREGFESALAGSPLRRRIHVLGYLNDADLPAAYTGADVFAYPSLGEGFGLPPLEAMACGTPVLTSSTSSIPEVVGDAAVTVEPSDESALAGALAGLMTDPRERQERTTAGLRRAALFRWDVIAAETLSVYAEAMVQSA